MTFSEQIRECLKKLGMKQVCLYSHFDVSPQSWASKMRGGKFSIEELQEIAKVLGVEYRFYFENKAGRKYRAMDYYDIVHKAMIASGHSMEEWATHEGITRQGFHKKLKKGKLSQEYLSEIAEFCGCKYEAGFVFPDGTFIS